MSKLTFSFFQTRLEDLSYVELKRLNHQIDSQLSKDEVGQVLAKHEDDISNGPHCNSHLLSRWGSTSLGHQRYRCNDCHKTFNTLTGTNLFRIKKPDKWLISNCYHLTRLSSALTVEVDIEGRRPVHVTDKSGT